MITALTGGTGFIGRHLVRRLLSDGENLRLLVRSPKRPDWLQESSAETVRVDLLDPSALKRALTGCHRLYHLAAYARNWAPDDRAFYRINVEGFRNILEAALAAGLQRVVYVRLLRGLRPLWLRPGNRRQQPGPNSLLYRLRGQQGPF